MCEKLLQILHLLDACPDLADSARRALLNPEEALVEGATNGATEPVHHAFTVLKPDKWNDAEMIEPEEELSDKILFLVNNLVPSNFESEMEEMKDWFEDRHARWFANYLVDQRVSTELNNHQLYLQFFEGVSRERRAGLGRGEMIYVDENQGIGACRRRRYGSSSPRSVCVTSRGRSSSTIAGGFTLCSRSCPCMA